MTESLVDMKTVVNRLSFLENQLHELHGMVSAQLGSESVNTPTGHPYITRSESILNGEPIVTGTRTPVRAVVEHWKFGDAPEDIVRKLPHLRLAQIFDALGYYDDHREEIERFMALNRVPVDD